MLSDNKGIMTSLFRWCDELLYFFDKGFAWDKVFDRLPKFRSPFELLVDCRFACRFVFTSPRFLVLFSPD